MKFECDDVNLAPLIATLGGVVTKVLLGYCGTTTCDLHPKAIVARIIAAVFLLVIYFSLILPWLGKEIPFLLDTNAQFGIGLLIGFYALEIIPIGERFLKKQAKEHGIDVDTSERPHKHDMVESS